MEKAWVSCGSGGACTLGKPCNLELISNCLIFISLMLIHLTLNQICGTLLDSNTGKSVLN